MAPSPAPVSPSKARTGPSPNPPSPSSKSLVDGATARSSAPIPSPLFNALARKSSAMPSPLPSATWSLSNLDGKRLLEAGSDDEHFPSRLPNPHQKAATETARVPTEPAPAEVATARALVGKETEKELMPAEGSKRRLAFPLTPVNKRQAVPVGEGGKAVAVTVDIPTEGDSGKAVAITGDDNGAPQVPLVVPRFNISSFAPTRLMQDDSLLKMADLAVKIARNELISWGRSVRCWEVVKMCLSLLKMSSWGDLNFKMEDVPSLYELMLTEGKVNSFIRWFLDGRSVTSFHDLNAAICISEHVAKFEDLHLGPLIHQSLVKDYFSLPCDEKIDKMNHITADEILIALDQFIIIKNGEELTEKGFLKYLAEKLSVFCIEVLGVKIKRFDLIVSKRQEKGIARPTKWRYFNFPLYDMGSGHRLSGVDHSYTDEQGNIFFGKSDEKDLLVDLGATGFVVDEKEKAIIDASSCYVSKIDYAYSEAQVKRHFQLCGHVKRVKILRNANGEPLGYAFVEYADISAAEKSISLLNGSEFHGRLLVVSFKRTNIPGMTRKKRKNYQM